MKNSLMLAVICAALGCGSEAGGAGSASASAATTGSAKAADKKDAPKDEKKADPAPKMPTPKLNKKQLDEGYDAGFGMAMMKEPLDKKLAAVEAKLGAPVKTDGDKKIWYAVDGDACTEMKLNTKDGTSVIGTTDKANCGL
jgi:hypothetical protein